jgi:hypothetical protein
MKGGMNSFAVVSLKLIPTQADNHIDRLDRQLSLPFGNHDSQIAVTLRTRAVVGTLPPNY